MRWTFQIRLENRANSSNLLLICLLPSSSLPLKFDKGFHDHLVLFTLRQNRQVNANFWHCYFVHRNVRKQRKVHQRIPGDLYLCCYVRNSQMYWQGHLQENGWVDAETNCDGCSERHVKIVGEQVWKSKSVLFKFLYLADPRVMYLFFADSRIF